MLEKTVVRFGNSSYVLIPKDFLDMLDISIGDRVSVKIKDEKIVIVKVEKEAVK